MHGRTTSRWTSGKLRARWLLQDDAASTFLVEIDRRSREKRWRLGVAGGLGPDLRLAAAMTDPSWQLTVTLAARPGRLPLFSSLATHARLGPTPALFLGRD